MVDPSEPVVTGAVPEKSPDGAVATAVATGDRRKILTAAMVRLAAVIDGAPTGQVAALVKQLSDLSRQIDEMGPGAGTESVDDIATAVADKLRGVRESGSAVPSDPTDSGREPGTGGD